MEPIKHLFDYFSANDFMIIKSGIRPFASFGSRFADIVKQSGQTNNQRIIIFGGIIQRANVVVVNIINVVFVLTNANPLA